MIEAKMLNWFDYRRASIIYCVLKSGAYRNFERISNLPVATAQHRGSALHYIWHIAVIP